MAQLLKGKTITKMNQNEVNKAIAAASALINDEHFNAIVESKAHGFSGKGSTNKGASTSEFAAFERQAFGTPVVQSNPTLIQETQVNNKIPTAIQESFKKMPPLTGNYMQQTIQDPVQNIQSVVDYNYIKYLVCEAIKENNSSLRAIKINEGNKIQLLDSNGNIYEGVLTLKKKIKSKKEQA